MPNFDNRPETVILLEEIKTALSSGTSINTPNNECIGVYTDIIEFGTQMNIGTPPVGTMYALATVTADPTTTDKSVVAHFVEFGTLDNLHNMPIGHGGVILLRTLNNITNFVATGLEDKKIHTLHVSFYS